MACKGDGWHKVGNIRVRVEDRVIVECLLQRASGEIVPCEIRRWNQRYHWYERTGKVTLAAFRSGLDRGTITVS